MQSRQMICYNHTILRNVAFVTVIALFCSLQLYAQGENNIWLFGHDAGIDFNSGQPVAIEKHIGADEGCASVCNENGQLLFYCIGTTVWNRNGQIMPNGSNIVSYSAIGSSQGAVIVPVVNSATQYYVFSLEQMEDIAGNSTACRLSYSVVDMSLNGGLGDVLNNEKGILLDSLLGEQMTAISGNDCNIWLLVHSRGINQFKTYQINNNGVSTAPIISITGNLHDTLSYLTGVIKSSPDRTKIALCSAGNQTGGIAGTTGLELYSFDPVTGIVSNAITLDSTNLCYGTDFSADNSKLYANGDLYQVHGEFLCQYDLNQPTTESIINSRTNLYENPYKGFIQVTDMRLAPDGKIYMNAAGSLEYMDEIANPDQAGMGCGYMSNTIQLVSNTTGDKGITNMYTVPVARDTTYNNDTLCLSANDSLILHAKSGYYFWQWNDSASDSIKVVKLPGIYWVKSKTYCEVHIDSFYVRSGELAFSLGDDTTICVVPYTLHAPLGTDYNYLWQDGSTAESFNVSQTGTYILTVDADGCKYSDSIGINYIDIPQQNLSDTLVCKDKPVSVTITVNIPAGANALWNNGDTTASINISDTGIYKVVIKEGSCKQIDSVSVGITYCDCIFAFPNAFTPNGDGKNDVFRIIDEPECPLSGYTLSIYNRWGQEVFTTTNPRQGWDGTYYGKPADIDTYMYQATFQAGDKGKPHKQTGDVILMR